ncbi:MAG: hypothetical protein AB2392_19640 [Neobacillus sp.]
MPTTTLKETVKKTGYSDIDELLTDTHSLIQDVESIQREIAEALKFKPVDPFSKPRSKPRLKLFRRNSN